MRSCVARMALVVVRLVVSMQIAVSDTVRVHMSSNSEADMPVEAPTGKADPVNGERVVRRRCSGRSRGCGGFGCGS